ncbi:unnamed protein product [Euphydryas editha]|uniref:Uncharacterized protein n=1 Tax=Euphydryas editha TaxID=104508 RepID=A0AAU9V5E7_EUPED|nr:unnamed protein product [Euphydryas editha]
MYEDLATALPMKSHYSVVMGDFKAKVGIQTGIESSIGPHGYGKKNHRGQMLVNFLESQGLFLMNSFYKKRPQRKWTWRSLDGKSRNEIDFHMTDCKCIFEDVSVVNRFNTASNHRLVRGSLNIDLKLERGRMMRSTLRPTLFQTNAGGETFQLQLKKQFDALAPTLNIDEDFENVVNILKEKGNMFCRMRHRGTKFELSEKTLEVMKARREDANATPSELRARTKKIRRLIRKALRRANTKAIYQAIGQNRRSKVFKVKSVSNYLGRSHMTKLRTHDGKIVTSMSEML